jgi:hypothetical protein
MELKTAIEILEKYNAYRRYQGEGIPPVRASPTDVGIALDVAIAALKETISPSMQEQLVKEIGEMSDEEFEANCRSFWIKKA